MAEGAVQATKAVPGAAGRGPTARRAIGHARGSRRMFPEPGEAAERSAGARSVRAMIRGASTAGSGLVPPVVSEALASPGQPFTAPVQRAGAPASSYAADADRVHEAAQLGTGGVGGPLPYLEAIQRSFGNHDVSRIVAHADAKAAHGSKAMGAEAFTTGDHVTFAGPPSLHTAAHEAAHAIQQRAGVHLPGGVGQAGDRYEQHADAVADLVVGGRSAEALLTQGAQPPGMNQAAVSASPHQGEASKKAGPASHDRALGTQGVQRQPAPSAPQPEPGLEQEKKKADSIYNKAVNAWSFLAQRQVLAIRSLYTEAQKPSKPSLAEQLLGALAEAALAGALGGIGGLLAGAIERKVTEIFVARALEAGAGRFRDAAGRFITNEAGIKLAAEASKRTAKFVSESAKDAMKEGVKSLAKPKIHALLSDGKEPIDAFFEGQMNTVVDAGKLGFDDAENKRADVLNDWNPIQAAQVEYEAMNDIYDAAAATQKDETLKNWLIYKAQIDAGVVEQGVAAGTTNLAGETWPDWYGSYQAGVLYVVVTRDLTIRKAHLKGSTANFVALLQDKPINKMGIPVIMDFDFPGIPDFYVNVNEKEFLWLVPRGGGAGNTFLRMHGGAHEVMGEEYGQVYTGWEGGDPITGGWNLWNNIIGPQKIKGILEPDK